MDTDEDDSTNANAGQTGAFLGSADDPIYTEDEAAAYLSFSRRTLQRIRASGGIRYIAYVRKVLYKRSHLEEFVASREMPATRVRTRRRRKRS